MYFIIQEEYWLQNFQSGLNENRIRSHFHHLWISYKFCILLQFASIKNFNGSVFFFIIYLWIKEFKYIDKWSMMKYTKIKYLFYCKNYENKKMQQYTIWNLKSFRRLKLIEVFLPVYFYIVVVNRISIKPKKLMFWLLLFI